MSLGIDVLFDIETVATDRARTFVEQKVYDLPKNLLTPQDMPSVIRAIKDERRRADRYEMWQVEQREKIKNHVRLQQLKDLEKAALYWWQSKIVSIAWCHMHSDTCEPISRGSSCSDNEVVIIKSFIDAVFNSPYGTVHHLIGKNSKNFDIPYLIGRLIALNLGVPDFLRARISSMGDIDEIFGSQSARNSQITTLENYAFGLGMDGKLMKATKVESLYRSRDYTSIKKYNVDDVRILTEIYRRWKRRYV